MSNVILIALIFICVVQASAQTKDELSKSRLTPATSDSIVKGWQTGDLLSSLIRLGVNNRIPLGIVIQGSSLCKINVPGTDVGISIAQLIAEIQKQDPDYTAEIINRILFVHPKAMTASTLDVLELRIPRFTTEPSNAQEVGISLWMYIRAVLVPLEGSAFTGGLQKNAETLPPINVTNLSVHDILDRVVTLGQGGIWVMREIPIDWHSNPNTKPFEIFSYGGDMGLTRLIKCPEVPN